MPPTSVVDRLDEFENRVPCSTPTPKGFTFQQLSLKGTKKSFQHAVVPAISFAAPAALGTDARQLGLKVLAGTLPPCRYGAATRGQGA